MNDDIVCSDTTLYQGFHSQGKVTERKKWGENHIQRKVGGGGGGGI